MKIHFALCTVLMVTTAHAWTPAPCVHIDVPDSFLFVDGLENDSNQDTFTFWLTPQSSTIPTAITDTNNNAVSLRPQCLDEAKVINGYIGSDHINLFSSTDGGTGFHSLKIQSACTGLVEYNVIRDATTFTYAITNTTGGVLGFAPESSDNAMHLVDGATKTVTLAHAQSVFGQHGLSTPLKNYAYGAAWNVTLDKTAMAAAGVDPTAVLFLLSMKTNQGMTCSPATAPPGSPSSSSNAGWVIGISLLLSVLVAVSVYLLFRRYYRQQDYAQMRVMLNENHEV